jgi:hypothetical protein
MLLGLFSMTHFKDLMCRRFARRGPFLISMRGFKNGLFKASKTYLRRQKIVLIQKSKVGLPYGNLT